MAKASSEPQDRADPPTERPVGRRLVVAIVLIAVAIGGLIVTDRFRQRPALLAPPHEPAQALIAVPVESDAKAALATQSTDASIPAQSGKDAISIAAESEPGIAQSSVRSGANAASTRAPGPAYLVQLGIFRSPANAQALQKQLRLAGIETQLETRVQLGPFQTKHEAQLAIARAKKLGIDAVLVGAR